MGVRFSICLVSAAFLLAPDGFSQDPGYDTYQSYGANLTPLQQRGRDTWYFWTGGGQRLWRKIAIITNGATDLLQYVDSRRNGRRFRDLGAITQPGCGKATQPDEYGLWFDQCESEGVSDIPGVATGLLGLKEVSKPGLR